MSKLTLVVVFTVLMLSTAAQAPSIKIWDARFGGILDDETAFFQPTSDGGFILAGMSFSPLSGNKTQDNWDSTDSTADYWIVKTDGNGNKEWDKRFGTTGEDVLSCIQQTADGGYILGGYTGMGVSGDKTQPAQGGYDYWIVKTDSLGNKQWDKTFGGSNDDNMSSILQTSDRGYLLGGWSISPASGDKTDSCRGGTITG